MAQSEHMMRDMVTTMGHVIVIHLSVDHVNYKIENKMCLIGFGRWEDDPYSLSSRS